MKNDSPFHKLQWLPYNGNLIAVPNNIQRIFKLQKYFKHELAALVNNKRYMAIYPITKTSGEFSSAMQKFIDSSENNPLQGELPNVITTGTYISGIYNLDTALVISTGYVSKHPRVPFGLAICTTLQYFTILKNLDKEDWSIDLDFEETYDVFKEWKYRKKLHSTKEQTLESSISLG